MQVESRDMDSWMMGILHFLNNVSIAHEKHLQELIQSLERYIYHGEVAVIEMDMIFIFSTTLIPWMMEIY